MTWPGRKQVWRKRSADGRMAGDVVALESAPRDGESLIVPVMKSGERVRAAPTLDEIRSRAASELARLPEPLRGLKPARPYPVEISPELERLAEQATRSLGRRPAPQFAARDARAFGHRLKFRPHDRGMNATVERPLRKAAISAGDNVLAPDNIGEPHNALGDKLGMLDHVGGVRDHAGNQHLPRRAAWRPSTPSTRAHAADWRLR